MTPDTLTNSIKLHIGCGDHLLRGWINTDLNPLVLGVQFLDAAKPFPIPDSTFDRVFSEHMIEHITYPQGRFMLRECFRILRSGGRIRISTPDLQFLLDTFASHYPEYRSWANGHFSPNCPDNPCTLLNNFVRAWGHQFIYNRETLKILFEEVGFTNITWHLIGESHDREFAFLENHLRMPPGFLQIETMTIEGEKP